jgi:hypothetical protein
MRRISLVLETADEVFPADDPGWTAPPPAPETPGE